MSGFEPLDDSSNALPQAGEGSGGTVSPASGGQGARSGEGGQGGSSGDSGEGGAGGQGGSGGMTMPPTGGSTPMPDAGPPVTNQCTGKRELDACDDGLYCTRNDYCYAGECVSGEPRVCEKECNVGRCDEMQNACTFMPQPDGTECGRGTDRCSRGACMDPVLMCTDGGDCVPVCTGRDCDVQCPNTSSCDATCEAEADCTIDCKGTEACKSACEDSTCTTFCQNTGTCDARCTGENTVCEVHCTDASGCENIDCQDGAACTLVCIEAESCGFRDCWAAEQQCDDGRITCNVPC